MHKKALLAVMMLILLTLVLTGCRLIVKDQAVDDATPILTLGDNVITKKEVKEKIDAQLKYNDTMYSYYGLPYDATSEEAISDAQNAVITSLKKEMVLNAKIKDLKLDALTEEEEATVQENAQTNMQSDLDYVKSQYFSETELEGEELEKAMKDKLTSLGYSDDDYQKNAREEFLDDKLRDYVIKDVEVTEEELTEEFDSRVAADKEEYDENAGAWVDAYMDGDTLYYTPSGVRLVKQILIKFTDEDQTVIDEAKSAVEAAETKVSDADKKAASAQEIIDSEDSSDDDKAQAQEDLAAAQAEKETAEKEHDEAHAALENVLETAHANIEAEADEVLAEIGNGADWDSLMAAKTQDPGMQGNSDTAVNGYTVAEGMTKFDSAFVDAAMALGAVGDVSDKVKSDMYGYYIIKYVNDAETGAVSLDSVHDDIQEELLSDKQDKTYDDTVAKWVDDADFKEDLKAIKD